MKLLLSSSRLGVILLASLVLTMTLRDLAHGKPTADDDDTSANGDDANKKSGNDGMKLGGGKSYAKQDKPGLDVTAIVSDIVGFRRKVILFAVLSKRLLVVISAVNAANNSLVGAVVFDQPPSTLNDTSLTLTSAQLFKDKWPKVSSTSESLVVLRDASKTYLVTINPNKLTFLNLDTPTTVPVDKSFDSSGNSNYPLFFGPTITTLSTSKDMTVYSFNVIPSDLMLAHAHLGGSDWPISGSIPEPNDRLFCETTGQGQVSFLKVGSVCKKIDWKITTGFVSSSYVLFLTSSSIIKFTGDPFASTGPFSFTTTPFASFWIAQPPTEPKLPTVKPKILVHHHSKLALIIIIAVVLSSLFIAALVFYLLRRRATNAKLANEQAQAANEEIPKGGSKVGSPSKVANRKSSKRSGKGRVSKGATTSSMVNNASSENGEQAGVLHEPTKLIAPSDYQGASNQKIIKLSRRRGGSLKRALSKPTVSSEKVPSTGGSSFSRHSSAPSRASSEKVASGRRSSLKRQGSRKRRVASGKGASSRRASVKRQATGNHRVSSRKTASPRRASLKRKGSLKRRTSGKASLRGTKR